MRLLNTRTEKLHEFFTLPRYAILSHTWGDEEVTYKDLTNVNVTSDLNSSSYPYRKLKGYAKIAGSCAVASREGFEWIWIDTCCIDKSSSAELSEAINSMFNWYKDSAVCYAYLGDIHSIPGNNTFAGRSSRWFTRGWTLQELVAPSSVVFLDADWNELGTKTTLADVLSTITGIDAGVLAPLPVVTSTGWGPQLHASDIQSTLRQCSIAQRMSWAANRTTTRLEDQAYSLMGLFGINMPLLYGEGAKAFLRLQREIMHTADDDMSIFVWRYPGHSRPNWSWSGLLAPSPECFAGYSDVRHYEFGGDNTKKRGLPPTPGQLIHQSSHARRTLDVSNTHVQLTASTLRLRKTTEKFRAAWTRSATGLKILRSRSSSLFLNREKNPESQDNKQQVTSAPNGTSKTPGFLDLDHFYRSTSDPLESKNGGGLILIILLDCWTSAGQIGLVLVDKQPAPLVRHHSRTVFAPLLLSKSTAESSSSSIVFSPPQEVRCKLFSDDSLFASSPDRMLVREPKARFLMKLVESGYTYSVVESLLTSRAGVVPQRVVEGPASSSLVAEFPCLDSCQPLVLVMRNAKNASDWPAFVLCGLFEFRQMRVQVTLLPLEVHDEEGDVNALMSPKVQCWLGSCKQRSENWKNVSQTRMDLKGTESEVVVKVRPSLNGIDVVVHLQDCCGPALQMGLESRLTGLTMREDD